MTDLEKTRIALAIITIAANTRGANYKDVWLAISTFYSFSEAEELFKEVEKSLNNTMRES